MAAVAINYKGVKLLTRRENAKSLRVSAPLYAYSGELLVTSELPYNTLH